MEKDKSSKLQKKILKQTYSLMCTARELSAIYEENKEVTSKYVHATSKGHEAIQIADMYALTVVGELHELNHQLPIEGDTVH